MNFINISSPFFKFLENIVFWYPYLMSLLWISGSLIFAHYREKNKNIDIESYSWPAISILVPCYNEESTVSETIKHLSKLNYPDYEIIAVNDGSNDNTGTLLKELANKYKCLKAIDCHENKGKANALHIAAQASKNEFLICIDSDAILDKEAPYHLIKHFLINGERVGAVTGNPRIRNRGTLLGKIQLVEYASIIGSIKRTQRILGKIMTVSGVIVAFRKKALVSVGLWDRDMITEDIAVSWKLERNFWDIRYEPNALCWMLVPETLSGLWKQRVRWAQGGQEIIFRHWNIFRDWRQRRLWPIYIEQVLSICWSFLWIFITLIFLFVLNTKSALILWFTFSSFALSMLSFIQLFISIKNESSYDNILKYYLWAAWYPTIYWIFNALVTIAALPKSIKSTIKGGYAIWSSPDRGNAILNDDCELEFSIDINEPKPEIINSITDANLNNQSDSLIITKSNQNIFKKISGFLFSLLMLCYMIIVSFFFISACFNYNNNFLSILKINFKVTNSDIQEFIMISIILFFICFSLLFIWKMYNKLHFGKLNRRKHVSPTTTEDMLSLNLTTLQTYKILQSNKIITFDKNPIFDLIMKGDN